MDNQLQIKATLTIRTTLTITPSVRAEMLSIHNDYIDGTIDPDYEELYAPVGAAVKAKAWPGITEDELVQLIAFESLADQVNNRDVPFGFSSVLNNTFEAKGTVVEYKETPPPLPVPEDAKPQVVNVGDRNKP